MLLDKGFSYDVVIYFAGKITVNSFIVERDNTQFKYKTTIYDNKNKVNRSLL